MTTEMMLPSHTEAAENPELVLPEHGPPQTGGLSELALPVTANTADPIKLALPQSGSAAAQPQLDLPNSYAPPGLSPPGTMGLEMASQAITQQRDAYSRVTNYDGTIIPEQNFVDPRNTRADPTPRQRLFNESFMR